MVGALSPFDYSLALALHRSVEELGDLSNDEYVSWQAYSVYRAAMDEKAGKEWKRA